MEESLDCAEATEDMVPFRARGPVTLPFSLLPTGAFDWAWLLAAAKMWGHSLSALLWEAMLLDEEAPEGGSKSDDICHSIFSMIFFVSVMSWSFSPTVKLPVMSMGLRRDMMFLFLLRAIVAAMELEFLLTRCLLFRNWVSADDEDDDGHERKPAILWCPYGCQKIVVVERWCFWLWLRLWLMC